MTDNPYTLTIADACRVAGGISRMTLYRWIEAKKFPEPRRFSARRLRWCQDDFDQWVAGHRT